jgi:hypothetical protein
MAGPDEERLARPVQCRQDQGSSKTMGILMSEVQNGLPRAEYLRLRAPYVPAQRKIIFVLESPPKSGRARIATMLCRGIGVLVLVTGILCIVVGIISPNDRIGPIVGGAIAVVLGCAFLLAKPNTAEQLASGVADL